MGPGALRYWPIRRKSKTRPWWKNCWIRCLSSVLKENPRHDWLKVARDHGLLTSGGSDLHGNAGRFPLHLGEFPIPYARVEGIIRGKKI